MNTKKKLKKIITYILLFLTIFNFIDLTIGKNCSYAAEMSVEEALAKCTRLETLDDKNAQDGQLIKNNKNLFQLNDKIYVVYMKDGKAYGLEYTKGKTYDSRTNPISSGGAYIPSMGTITEYDTTDKDVSKALGLNEFYNNTDDSTSDSPYYLIPGNRQGDSNINNPDKEINDDISELIDGLAGIILYPAKILPLLLGKVISYGLGWFAGSGTLTVDKILFNEVPYTDIDFFNFNSSEPNVNLIRENVAIWYYSIRNIAAVALIIIAIYVGIRMAMATVASEKAKYSSMLVNWLTSLALLFVLHYIMILIINVNNKFVELIKPTGEVEDVTEKFWEAAWNIGFTKGVGSAIAYLLLVGMSFVFLLSYLKRMITIAFLIIISPLITVTYSIDKMGDNKSQALNTWLKEFGYNVIIQPFQCITYRAIGETALNLLTDVEASEGLGTVILAITMLIFIYSAEKIVRHIFHMKPESMADTVGNAVFATTAINAISKGGEKFAKNVSGPSVGGKTAKQAKKTSADSAENITGMVAKKEKGSGEANGISILNSNERQTSNRNNGVSKNENNLVGNAAKKVGKGKNTIKGAVGAIGRSKLLRGYIGLNARAAGIMTGVALGGAMGSYKNMFSGATSLYRAGEGVSDWYNQRAEKSSLNKAIDDYSSAHPDMTREQVREHVTNIMRGEYDGDYEKEDFKIKSAIDDLNKRNGIDDEKTQETIDSVYPKQQKKEPKRFTKSKNEQGYGEQRNTPEGENNDRESSPVTTSRRAENAREDSTKAEAEMYEREDGTPI